MSESKPHQIPDTILVPAIAAHRKVNPDGYRMSGRLTVIEEDAMKAALAGLFEQLEFEREHSLIFERDNQRLCDERDRLKEQLEALEWFLRHRTADEGMTQWDVYEQIDWSTHPEFASNPAKNPLRKPGRSSECGHDGWQAGCPVCEREERDALQRMGERSPATEPKEVQ